MAVQEATDELDLVLKAFDTGRRRSRTPGGVARDTGLPLEQVLQTLQHHPEYFVVSSTITPSGLPYYTIKNGQEG